MAGPTKICHRRGSATAPETTARPVGTGEATVAPETGDPATGPAVAPPRQRTAPRRPDTPSEPRPARKAPRRSRRWTRATRIGVTVVLIVSLAEAATLGTRYLLTDYRWVIADNAQIDGDASQINAPATGVLTDWDLTVGSTVTRNENVGRIQIQGSGAMPKRPIRSPGRGSVAETMATEGMWVTQGSLLAVAYQPGDIYVTARVPEDEIAGVRVGAPVDVLVDAAPGVPVTGMVSVVGASSAGVSELENDSGADPLSHQRPIYPGPNTDPQNPQRVNQYIPVKILFTRTGSARVTPGQNVTVHIHRW